MSSSKEKTYSKMHKHKATSALFRAENKELKKLTKTSKLKNKYSKLEIIVEEIKSQYYIFTTS